jgi:hypothetical protein
VVLTDRFDVLNLLEASAKLNPSLNVKVAELSWGESCEAFADSSFDFIVASEVIYNGLLYEKLLKSIKGKKKKKKERESENGGEICIENRLFFFFFFCVLADEK